MTAEELYDHYLHDRLPLLFPDPWVDLAEDYKDTLEQLLVHVAWTVNPQPVS